jgi:uncharacterized protein
MPAKPPKEAGPGQGTGKGFDKGPAKPCPICGKPAAEASRPFCSERCRDVDLNRWLSNSYAIPATKEDDEGAD